MITVVKVEEQEQVRDARRHAVGEVGWLLFHLGLAAGTAYAGWVGVAGVWPPVWWLLAGLIAGDAVSGFRSTSLAVWTWRQMRRSTAYRLLLREVEESRQRAWSTYRARRGDEVEQERARRRGTAHQAR